MNLKAQLPVAIAAAALGFAGGLFFRSTENRAPDPGASLLSSPESRQPKSSHPASQGVATNNPPGPAAARTMDEDLAAALHQREEGNYILDSDIPLLRRKQEEHQKRVVEFCMASRDDEYRDLFAALGVDDKTSSQLRQHLAAIFKAKIQASQALGQLVAAESAYDERIELLLGDNYASYLAFENAYPSRREYREFNQHASSSGVSIAAVEQSKIEELLRKHGAYSPATVSDWGGPYSEPPPPFAGKSFLPKVNALFSGFAAKADAVVADARANGLRPEVVSALEGYFAGQVSSLNKLLSAAADPIGTRIEALRKQLQVLQSAAQPDPRAIARTELLLHAWLKKQAATRK